MRYRYVLSELNSVSRYRRLLIQSRVVSVRELIYHGISTAKKIRQRYKKKKVPDRYMMIESAVVAYSMRAMPPC